MPSVTTDAPPSEAIPSLAPGTWEEPMPLSCDQTVVAGYRSHAEAEKAIRRLAEKGVTLDKISLIGRNFETREDVEGFYRPSDAALDGAQTGAWFGGLFGLLLGTGFFFIPVIGPVFVLGPFAGLVAGAIGGAGVGALTSGLISLGIPQDQAVKYQAQVRSGEFLVVVHGATAAETDHACATLQGTGQAMLQTHTIFHGGTVSSGGTVITLPK